MWTVGAFNESRASAVTTLDELNYVDDDHIRGSGEDLYVPALNRLFGVYATHVKSPFGYPTGCRIASPVLRRLWPLDIARLAGPSGALGDANIEMFPGNPIALETSEALNALMTNGAEAGAYCYVGVFFSDGPIAPFAGDIRTIKATSTLAGTPNAWTSGPLALAQDLPVGRYQLVGARVIGWEVSGLYRFIFIGYTWRPGGILHWRERYSDFTWFRRGKLGVWGEFAHDQPPRLEVISPDTASNPDVYLDVIKVA